MEDKEKKNSFFGKRSWEVVESKEGLWKTPPKRTENEAKTKLAMLLKTNDCPKNEAKNKPGIPCFPARRLPAAIGA